MTPTPENVSAHIDGPVQYAKPRPLPAMQLSHCELSEKLRKLWREMNTALGRCPGEMHTDLRHWLAEVNELRAGTSLILPGMPEPESRKARGTQAEVYAFFGEMGLPRSDADYFFNKQEGCGWKVNKVAIKNWKAVVRSWEAAKYFPSQKVMNYQGNQVQRPPSIADKEIEREARLIRKGDPR